MQELPLVSAEVQRVGAAFDRVCDELEAALRAVRDADVGDGARLAPPPAAGEIATGLADLEAALSRLLGPARDSRQVLRRHADPGTPDTAQAPTATDAREGP